VFAAAFRASIAYCYKAHTCVMFHKYIMCDPTCVRIFLPAAPPRYRSSATMHSFERMHSCRRELVSRVGRGAATATHKCVNRNVMLVRRVPCT
jgi:hypothetical protein